MASCATTVRRRGQRHAVLQCFSKESGASEEVTLAAITRASHSGAYEALASSLFYTDGAGLELSRNLSRVALRSPTNAPFFCVEPVTDFGDAELSSQRSIELGATAEFTVTIALQP